MVYNAAQLYAVHLHGHSRIPDRARENPEWNVRVMTAARPVTMELTRRHRAASDGHLATIIANRYHVEMEDNM
ncbi:unnamed protein product [Lampetra planeri]